MDHGIYILLKLVSVGWASGEKVTQVVQDFRHVIYLYGIFKGVAELIKQCQGAVQDEGQEKIHILCLLHRAVWLGCLPGKLKIWLVILINNGVLEGVCKVKIGIRGVHPMLHTEFTYIIKGGIEAPE